MARTFIIADTHFCHKNIIKYCNRPFASIEEMDTVLMSNWNAVVCPQDTVYVLGDFLLGTVEQLMEITKKLNGHKILIKGNHDRFTDAQYERAGFESVIRGDFNIRGFKLRHYPPQAVSKGPNIVLFGHIHDKKIEIEDKYNICVSADRNIMAFTPKTIEQIMTQNEILFN